MPGIEWRRCKSGDAGDGGYTKSSLVSFPALSRALYDNYKPRIAGSVLRALFPVIECGWLVNSPLAHGPLAAARGRLFG
jgi:hypothetical protein